MLILGLTGSIGMGKSEAAKKFRAHGAPVFDSDGVVHDLMAPHGEAFADILALFPDVLNQGAIDRQKLGRAVFDDDGALRSLESILHPRVRRKQEIFVKTCMNKGASMVVLDIPLLFETHAETRCDAVAVASAPGFLQAQRVLARPGMSPEKFKSILARQVPDYIKRKRADFVISTGLGHGYAYRQIAVIIETLRTRQGSQWPPGQHGHKKFDLYGNLHA
ncbi:MAG: dephospho-CoA kinase [Rhodospirillales bacterium]|jgi:dephospho-CoA kinase|nr:dephospho-CoA kinase [Rhodospirillales bacterium]